MTRPRNVKITATHNRHRRWSDQVAFNEAVFAQCREGYKTKVIAARLGVPPVRVQRIARAYAGAGDRA